ncbi:hypothetical protein [Streptomyces sp. NPDC002994]|uniref:hypothetical protein n=1 Tax=Streptomyces sp. NPDC002994 TaxID=3154441 RepID=UPI0033B69BFD
MAELRDGERGYAADPEAIKKAGGDALEIRQALLAAAEPTCTATRRAAGGVDGWLSEDQLKSTARLWDEQNNALAERIGRTGGNLQYNSQNYRAAEVVNSSGMQGGDIPWG